MVEHEYSKPNQKIALVTGGAKRVGAAIARSLVEAGYAVVVHANNSLDEAEALAAELRQSSGDVKAIRADLSKEADRDGVIAKAMACFGPLSLLRSAAGFFGRNLF